MNWLQRMMMGRYGLDQLSIALLVIAVVLNVLAGWTNTALLSIFSVVFMVLGVWRMFSKNINKRREENFKFQQIYYKTINFFRQEKNKFNTRKTHKYFKCPSCKNTLRVPRGKGKIYITCPKCGERFIGKT